MADHRVTVAQIQAAVCLEFALNPIEMISRRSARAVARPRQVAMYLSRELTVMSLPRIGHHFGNRDHTTVMHAVRRVADLMAMDPVLSLRIAALQSRLQSPEPVEHF